MPESACEVWGGGREYYQRKIHAARIRVADGNGSANNDYERLRGFTREAAARPVCTVVAPTRYGVLSGRNRLSTI